MGLLGLLEDIQTCKKYTRIRVQGCIGILHGDYIGGIIMYYLEAIVSDFRDYRDRWGDIAPRVENPMDNEIEIEGLSD